MVHRRGSTTRRGSTSTCARTVTSVSSPVVTTRRASTTTATPFKPVLDGEPLYEDHPVSFNAKRLGSLDCGDVRRPLYWDLFSGACGHTYGHHSVWQMWTPARQPINNPLLPWHEAIDQPGAGQMQYGRALIESRPFLTRIPDP